MPKDKIKITCGGESIGFIGLLTVLFIGLKLTGLIDWSWWWVLCPIWIDVIFCIVVAVLIVLFDNKY